MSDEYEYGPWVGWNGGECPVELGTMVQVCYRVFRDKEPAKVADLRRACEWCWSQNDPSPIIAYRIATPKPKRELVVGKWYLSRAGHWRRVIAIEHNNEHGAVWMTPFDSPDEASLWKMSSALDVIDWSTPSSDEAPE